MQLLIYYSLVVLHNNVINNNSIWKTKWCNDSCLAMGEGTSEKIFRVEPLTSLTLVGWPKHWASRTPDWAGSFT